MRNAIACEPPAPRIVLDDAGLTAVSADRARSAPSAPPTSDLKHVEELLERCWRELDTVDLNVKLTDLIRLLEFKHKLGPGHLAERAFWELIEEIRRDELRDFGDPEPSRNNPRETDDS